MKYDLKLYELHKTIEYDLIYENKDYKDAEEIYYRKKLINCYDYVLRSDCNGIIEEIRKYKTSTEHYTVYKRIKNYSDCYDKEFIYRKLKKFNNK